MFCVLSQASLSFSDIARAESIVAVVAVVVVVVVVTAASDESVHIPRTKHHMYVRSICSLLPGDAYSTPISNSHRGMFEDYRGNSTTTWWCSANANM